jgi:hypothetical protein
MLCDYGCGQKATHQFKNGKWCCSKFVTQCPQIVKQNTEANRNIWKNPKSMFNSEKYRKKLSKACKGKLPWNKNKSKNNDTRILNQSNSLKCTWNDKNSFLNSREYRNNLRLAQNKIDVKYKKSIGRKNSIKILKIKYPFFSRIEEMRYNPDKPGEKEIQVHCKNHLCPNSKEQGGWFTPTYSQLYERIRQLENNSGNDGSYFYCSDECKNECPLYGLQVDLFKETSEKLYTQSEYQQFRQYVLERDNYKCQYCGQEAEHVHHERPQKLEPFFALDPDLAWSVCKKCHYKYGHKDECSTGNLANMVC